MAKIGKIKYILLALLLPVVARGTLILDPVQTNIFNITNEVNVGSVSVTNNIDNVVTNIFSPSITNIIGATTINNTNNFEVYVSNVVQGVVVTNITEAAVNIYNTTQVITSGVSSISFTGAVDGAIVLTNTSSEAVKLGQTLGTFTFDVNNQIPLIVANTNVSGNWQIDYTVGQAALYIQTGAITSQSFNVTSTNNPSSQLVVLRTSTNAITWRTNIIWAAGSAPTTDTSEDESFVFQTYKNKTRAGYLQDE